MAQMERHFARKFENRAFSGSNGWLQATWHIVRQRATDVRLAFALSVTCSLTRALFQSLTHAQQLFSASTAGQINISAEGPGMHFNVQYYMCIYIVHVYKCLT